MLSAGVARCSWLVRRRRWTPGHALVEGLECHCPGEEEMSGLRGKGFFHPTVFSLLLHGPRPALGYTPLQYHSPQKESNGIVSPVSRACPPRQILARLNTNEVRDSVLVVMSGHTGRMAGTTLQRRTFRSCPRIPSSRRVSHCCSSCRTSAKRKRPTTRIG